MPFEGILSPSAPAPRSWRRATIAGSLAAHGALLSVGIIHSLWQVDEMPLPSIEVTLAPAPPAPPPPPPPASQRAKTEERKTPARVPHPDTWVEPEKAPEQNSEEPEEEGEEGGEEGGVQGGVVGGVVGGALSAPTPRKKKRTAELVSALTARAQLLINPSDPRYRVSLPPQLARTGKTYTALLLVCVSAQGTVDGVNILRSAEPTIDPQFPQKLGRWRYRPLLRDGRPTPFCYRLRYRVSGR